MATQLRVICTPELDVEQKAEETEAISSSTEAHG